MGGLYSGANNFDFIENYDIEEDGEPQYEIGEPA